MEITTNFNLVYQRRSQGNSSFVFVVFVVFLIVSKAATQIEKIVRGFLARRRVRRIAQTKYSKYYDSKQDKFYYFNQTTNETSWTASQWLLKQVSL